MISADGKRSLPWHEFLVGVKRNALQPDELIAGVRWRTVRGTGSFSKIGTRNAMVISMAGLCLLLDEEARAVRVALGSVAPTIVRAAEAEAFAAAEIARAGAGTTRGRRFPKGRSRSSANASRAPRSRSTTSAELPRTAATRCVVLGRRALAWALEDRRG